MVAEESRVGKKEKKKKTTTINIALLAFSFFPNRYRYTIVLFFPVHPFSVLLHGLSNWSIG